MKRIIFCLIAGIILCGGCSQKAKSPEQAFFITKKAVLKSHWNRYWEMLSDRSKQRFDEQVEYMKKNFDTLSDTAKERLLESLDISYADFKNLDGHRFFLRYMISSDKIRKSGEYTKDLFASCEVINIEQKDNRAILTIQDEEGHEGKIPVVKENDGWKLDVADLYSF